MKARDFMTSSVLSVDPDTPVQRVAELLLEHGISAVPVVDNSVPVGLISESDLVSRSSTHACSRRCWGVRLLALGSAPEAEHLRSFEHSKVARDVMTSPVITTSEESDAGEILRLMTANSIKRLPVVKTGRIVGIISRADLLRAIAQGLGEPDAPSMQPSPLGTALIRLHKAAQANGRTNGIAGQAASCEEPHVISAEDFRASVSRSKAREARAKAEQRRLAADRHAHEVEVLLGTHISEDTWRRMLLDARHAADSGAPEHQVLRIPRQVCTDGGRMINAGEAGWTSTLRGKAAEVWLRWRRDLQPRGFRLTARTLEYPDGLPGDIGLFLVWGGG
jgi:CBS domain-containing protein